MFITKKNRILVYSYLFKEGTLVAKKDFYATTHSEALPIPNLEVIALLKSFNSKGFVKCTFNWQYYYYYLTNEGIEYLREYLALPTEVLPATHKQSANTGKPMGDRPNEREGGRREGGFDKNKGGPGGDFNPQFAKDGGRGGREGYRAPRGAPPA